MGVVFRARQTDLNRIVAIKMILVNRLASQDHIRRFYQEAQAAGRLSHPNIVGIHEVGEILGQHFFSMDCIDGLNLRDVLAAGPPEDPKTRFQEWAHASLKETPRYETIGDSGGEQDEQRFRVAVSADGRVWGTGVGRSKQAAEREAARDALRAAEARDE